MNELTATQTVAAPPRTWKPVYTIVERAERKFWIRIGTAFVNRDQSMTVKLDASPINGELQIREETFSPAARRSGGAGGGEPFAPTEGLS